MTSTTFVDKTTLIEASWLNDVDALVYQGQLDDGTTGASISQYLPAGTGAVATTVQSKLRESVSVKDFGAVGDGVTDDTAAIQAACDYMRSIVVGEKIVTLLFPNGTYLITQSINLTNILNFVYWCVEATGANFLLNCAGHAGFDLMGSRSCNWNGGKLTGHATLTPTTGIQVGRSSNASASADNHSFYCVDINGYYTLACFYNYASEANIYYGMRLGNKHASESSYCLCMDGSNVKDIRSMYTAVAASGTPASFNSCSFIGLDARKGPIGPAIWMHRTAGHSYRDSYAVSYTSAGVIIYYTAGDYGCRSLTLDMHFETSGLLYGIDIQSEVPQTIYLIDLYVRDFATAASNSHIHAGTNASFVVITGLKLAINKFATVTPTIFGPMNLFNVQGEIASYDAGDVLNINGLANFSGTFIANPLSAKTLPSGSVNSYIATDNSGLYHMANINLVGKSANNHCLLNFLDYARVVRADIFCDIDASNIHFRFGAVSAVIVNSSYLRPAVDNTIALGFSSYRYTTVYAATGTINTSDRREKQQIQDLTTAERAVAQNLKTLIKSFKFNSAVAEKGDQARIHFGVIAQDVISAFALEGLDATKYALLCYDQWDETVDEEGKVTPAGDRYGVRYDELLAFMISVL